MSDEQSENGVKSRIDRLRKRPGIDHLVRAYEAFNERYGNHFAASITYFSVLSLFPLLLVAFAVLGFALAGQPDALTEVRNSVSDALPDNPSLRDLLNKLIDTAIDERGKVGVIGLVSALYTGLGWMSNLRNALTAQWGHKLVSPPFLRGTVVDLLSLLGLGLAMAVSFGLSAVGTGLSKTLLDLVGLGDSVVASVLLYVITVVLSLGANFLVFLWVIARLPRQAVGVRSAVRGAAAAAVGFEVLKAVGALYLSSVLGGPLGSIVGPVVGLLVFANLVSRFVLFITAWTATAKENAVTEPVQPPAPAVIRPVLEVAGTPKPKQALGLIGVGAGLALLLRRRKP
ncbi:inner membrane protein YhjD [Actinokineospora bangkokensis]|uniref:Inner membrane protein YhjD n=1 Tax=Actinokineospora bangkokensis TaxID=1193682 RepID=A0A1Q9LET0_9PSEU|nr:inner membrane protein YhjD [Actinokineospora bangkokensis]OLR90525.1 inner membrane protein YhjD [Actinokineospora bangkokensis]